MRHPDQWYTSKQISEQLVVSIGSVTMSLKKLRKTNIIKYRNTGKRNTFQYMVQSEPAKLAERKTPMLDSSEHEPVKVKIKIKPKIVHQHTYLGGQTFYGVIRPKEEVDALERQKQEQQLKLQRKTVTRKTLAKRMVSARVRRAKKTHKTVRKTRKKR